MADGTLKVGTITTSSGSGTITLGQSGETITIPSGVSQSGLGITMADQWRITANFSTTSADITANWERADSDGAGFIGTGMSESSGVFTFPSTGIYLVQGISNIAGSGTRTYMGINILTTLDNSSYSAAAEMYGASYNSNAQVACEVSFIFDVTNTTNCKVKLKADGSGTGVWQGGTNELRTGMNFIRLGDT